MRQGKSDLALTELKQISDVWMSRWFISYLYEINFNLKKALSEVEWLMTNSRCRGLQLQLRQRKESIEKAIRDLKDWEERQEPSVDKDKKIWRK
jgi:hypothetical protein